MGGMGGEEERKELGSQNPEAGHDTPSFPCYNDPLRPHQRSTGAALNSFSDHHALPCLVLLFRRRTLGQCAAYNACLTCPTPSTTTHRSTQQTAPSAMVPTSCCPTITRYKQPCQQQRPIVCSPHAQCSTCKHPSRRSTDLLSTGHVLPCHQAAMP